MASRIASVGRVRVSERRSITVANLQASGRVALPRAVRQAGPGAGGPASATARTARRPRHVSSGASGGSRCRWTRLSHRSYGAPSPTRRSGLAEHLRDEEGELEGLDAVEAGVADGLVAVGQAHLVDL